MIPISICYEITVWTELKWAWHIAECHSAQRRNDLWPFADIIIHYFYICLHLFWIVSNCERIIIKCIHVIVNCRRRVRAYMLIFARKTFLSMNCVFLIAYCLRMHTCEIIGFEWISSWFLHNAQMLVFPTKRWFNCFSSFVCLFRNFRVRAASHMELMHGNYFAQKVVIGDAFTLLRFDTFFSHNLSRIVCHRAFFVVIWQICN